MRLSPALRSPLPALVAGTGLAFALLVVRAQRTGSHTYFFLAYNLFLAWIPFGLSALTRALHRSRPRLSLLVGLAWWLFFPNAFYLVTDLVHFRHRPNVPYWYDVAVIATFGWCGTLLALASLRTMHAVVRARHGALAGWGFALFACVSSGFGIWLGRVRRWNSWDAALHPLEVAADSLRALAHPQTSPDAWGVTLAFGGLFAVLYLGLGSISLDPWTPSSPPGSSPASKTPGSAPSSSPGAAEASTSSTPRPSSRSWSASASASST